MPQDLGMDVDLHLPPTNMEVEVGGQQGLKRVVEEVEPTNLDDEVESVGELFLGPHQSLVPSPEEVHLSQKPTPVGQGELGRDVNAQILLTNLED